MNLGTFATGFIGWELGLDLRQSILVIIFGSVAGGMITVSIFSITSSTNSNA